MPFGCHTLLLSQEGDLLAFGNNDEGQLGLGHKNNQLTPAKVSWNGPQPVQVDCALEHSIVLDAEGGVWEAGNNRISPSSLTFQRVPELPPIALVAAGYAHSAAIDIKGDLWVWACSAAGLSWASLLPQRVEGLPPLIKVACGNNFLVAEADEGLWVLGDNSQGQLGLGHTNNALQPTLVQVEERSAGSLRCLAALFSGLIVIDSEGAVFSAGSNSYGELGRSGSALTLQRISGIPLMVDASSGYYHTLALDETGGVWTWGYCEYGQLGMDNTSNLPTCSCTVVGRNMRSRRFWSSLFGLPTGWWLASLRIQCLRATRAQPYNQS